MEEKSDTSKQNSVRKKTVYNKRKTGFEKEQLAADYLSGLGMQILERNFYTRTGEIDLIAKDGDYLVFLEVKYRAGNRYGYPEEAVTPAKQQRIIRSARYYLYRQGLSETTPCRFDVLAIQGNQIRLIRNAFGVY